MAVLAPILERKINTENDFLEKKIKIENNCAAEVKRSTFKTTDEDHNARIKSNYEKLINPDSTVNDIISNNVQQKVVEQPAVEQTPFWVENARADSDLFRVDSMINNRQVESSTDTDQDQEEEENEDLRPSEETFKYRTVASSKVVIDDKISNKETKVSKFSKRDKIIMAVALLVIVALFVLVIVNSAVLSNLNNQVSSLQTDLVEAQGEYNVVLEDKQIFFDNIEQTVADFARQAGMSQTIGD